MTAYRAMLDSDHDFVVSGWSSSFRTSKHAGLIAMATYADTMHLEIDAILKRSSTSVIVAHEPGEVVMTNAGERPFLYGFIATRNDLPMPYVYYVYVKSAFRRARRRHGRKRGHAEDLFAAAGVDRSRRFGFACRTAISDQIQSDHKIPLAEWDPLPARFERPQ
jgi:hypothetical protein